MTDVAAHVDLLTGAWSRTYFEAQLARAVQEANRRRKPLSLLWFDVDNVHELNDLHGRTSVDSALSWVASRIAEVLDGEGPIGRVGGDEFASFLVGCPLDRAFRLSERLRRMLPSTRHSSSFGDYELTFSVGVATHRFAEPWGNLLDAAEQACMRAKQGGRDLVVSR